MTLSVVHRARFDEEEEDATGRHTSAIRPYRYPSLTRATRQLLELFGTIVQ